MNKLFDLIDERMSLGMFLAILIGIMVLMYIFRPRKKGEQRHN